MKLEKSLIITIISVFILGVVSTLVYQASNGNNKGNSIKSENVASVSKEVKENEKNKKMVVDFYNEVFNKHNIDIILNMLAKIISNIILLLLMDEKPSWISLRRILLKILIPLQRLNV